MTLAQIISDLESQIAANEAYRTGKGTRVAYFGPFHSATSSTVKDLRKLVELLKKVECV